MNMSEADGSESCPDRDENHSTCATCKYFVRYFIRSFFDEGAPFRRVRIYLSDKYCRSLNQLPWPSLKSATRVWGEGVSEGPFYVSAFT